MFARIWKEDKLAISSAEQDLEAFQREELLLRLYIREALIEEGFGRVSETLSVRSVGATTHCGRITLFIQCTNIGKRKEDETVDNHSREELIVSTVESRLACIRAIP
ncbi:hypothetical protein F511_02021 [Dorcoceras hygrometricum]|uniref:Uncharacterized protein n=1 Tax=Dorcoceras hygrometricum TaxID=472368 RepID=A0A2Z7AA33_9LAMI|nr:hypothetical protein F511_02021 [Dorcoceras hygrometricum]